MKPARVLLGDWSRWLRDPIDLLRLSYVVGVPVVEMAEFTSDHFLGTDSPRPSATRRPT